MKKQIVLALSALLCISLLAACGQKQPADAPSAQPESGAAVTEEAGGTKADEAAAEGETVEGETAEDEAAEDETAKDETAKEDASAEDDTAAAEEENTAEARTFAVSDAVLNSVSFADAERVPVYDAEHGVVSDLFPGASAVYTMPEDFAAGTYDIYLEVGRSVFPYGSTPFGISVNGGPQEVLPIPYEGASEEDGTNLWDTGVFAAATNIDLKAGDTVAVIAKDGLAFSAGVTLIPQLGGLILAPNHEPVPVGYGEPAVAPLETADESDPLSGKDILWVGSSVTYGQAAGGYSMADYIADSHPATRCYKYAISGTTLVNDGDKPGSYVERIQEVDKDLNVDLVVIQLSTNDATNGKPMGEVSDSTSMDDFDVTTITGAEEFLIAYAKETWDCPVYFYTGSYYESEEYAMMVAGLYDVCDKWDAGVVNLWEQEDMRAVRGTETYDVYMSDPIHPTREGYVEWWGPKFEEVLAEALK